LIRKLIRNALTKSVVKPGRGRGKRLIVEEEPPSERLVWIVSFSITCLACLTALEIAYLTVMHQWNSEIFAAITSLVGTVLGVFLGKKG